MISRLSILPSILRAFLPGLVLLCCQSSLWGKVDEYYNEIKGAAIVTNATFSVTDDKYLSYGDIEYTNKVSGIVVVEFNEDDLLTRNADYSYTVGLEIKAYNAAGTLTTINKLFTINYYQALGSVSGYRATLALSGYHKLEIKVTTPPADNSRIRIYAKVIIDRVYNFNAANYIASGNLSSSLIAGTNKLGIYWTPIVGADEYDLEYAFYNELSDVYMRRSSLSYTGSGPFERLFKNNATRVSTFDISATIYLLYPKGYVLYRVRPVHYDKDGMRIEGIWSSFNLSTGTLSASMPHKYDVGTAHVAALNWQFQKVVTENDRSGVAVNYLDGSLRSRQSVAELKEENKLLIHDQLFDHFGRPVIKVLPYVANTADLKYTEGLYGSPSTRVGKNQYDNGACGLTSVLLDSTDGSSKYYSRNSWALNVAPFLPLARGYGYSSTEFTPDPTNRISRSGAPGEALRIGSGRETKYFYSQPNQRELDRLFGTDVGYADMYYKNMVQDPNGQVSISYLDNKGRVIASALAGAVPANLTGIASSAANPYSISDSLMKGDIVDGKVVLSKTITLSQASDVVIYTGTTPAEYQSISCLPVNFCFDCYYDVSVTVRNRCGTINRTKTLKNYVLGQAFSTGCNGPSAAIRDTIFLPQSSTAVGEIYVTKEISLHDPATQYYADFLVANNNCLPLKDSLVARFRANMPAKCNVTCAQCQQSLGTKSAFVADFRAKLTASGVTPGAEDDQFAEALYDDLKAECDELCKAKSECEILRVNLVADMIPGAQYARYGYDPATDAFSAGDAASIFYGNPMRYTTVSYLDVHGQAATVMINGVAYDVNELPLREFIENFDPAWADALLPLHPEYCVYEACKELEPYLVMDTALQNIMTYAEAVSRGLITGGTPTVYTNDPFFTNPSSPGYSLAGSMNSWLNDVGDGGCTVISLFELINSVIYCGGTIPCVFSNPCDSDKDLWWNTYKGLYYGKKRDYICRAIATEVASCAIQVCVGVPTCAYSNPNIYASKVRRWSCPEGLGEGALDSLIAVVEGEVLTEIGRECDTVCLSYVPMWKEQLAGCGLTTMQMNALMDRFVAICRNGCDSQHPFGSSTCPTATVYGDLNFQQAMDAYISPNNCANNCRAQYLLVPPRYNDRLVAGTPMTLFTLQNDTCICTQLTKLKTCFDAKYPGPGPTFGTWLRDMGYEEISQADLDVLTNRCTTTCKAFGAAINIPAYLQCGVCKDSAEVKSAYNAYVALCGSTGIDTSSRYAAYMNNRLGLNLEAEDYSTYFTNAAAYAGLSGCNKGYLLCPRPIRPPSPDTSCYKLGLDQAIEDATRLLADLRDSLRKAFINNYSSFCLGARDTATIQSNNEEYHYTLYYYDQAGNLVMTVPPDGVVPITNPATLTSVITNRNTNGASVVPAHLKQTKYWYNSLNQVVKKVTPDEGLTQYWYDRLGRIIISQHSAQVAGTRYSYTRYDAEGRVIESGEGSHGTVPDQAALISNAGYYNTWYGGLSSLKYIVNTYYDNVIFTGATLQNYFGPLGQENLRKRVATTTYRESSAAAILHASHYSYDINGNLKTLIQDITLESSGTTVTRNMLKRIEYQYELVSGQVIQLAYQRGDRDALFHRYEYDADNRLAGVYTSNDSLVWRKDASYSYYPQGPLKRKELGEYRVQGMDYFYTLQGLLKGVNGAVLDSSKEAGLDGYTVSLTHPNRWVASDAIGFTLGYYAGDYHPIGSGFSRVILSEGSTFFNTQSRSLYNGNIRNAVYGYKNVASSVSRGYSYQYDQLNRLLQMYGWDSYNASTMAWNNTSPLTAYQNMLSYSADGNISTQLRMATGSMDSLTYFYLNNADPLYPSQQSNRLNYVKDQAGNAGLGDLPNQTTGNYSYTSNGNLSADASENLGFTWTPSNKLERVNKTSGGNTHTFRYSYDALGNRLSKRITYSTGSLPDNDTTWYYVRDAQGNPLATYIQYGSLLNSTPTYLMYLKEQMLYGSDRLGVQSQHKIVYKPLGGLPSLTDTIRQFLGATAYELTNHLGNVLATISDRHLGRAAAPGAVNHYLADILTQTDFYPFGMGMPGRTYAAGQYRYGFNGQEKDDGISGVGNHNTALFWEYDTRVGRRWNQDPIQFADISPYAVFEGNPILYSDPDGDCPTCPTSNAKAGDTYQWAGQTFSYDGKDWAAALPEVEINAIATGKSDPGFQKWINNIGVSGIKDFSYLLYQNKLAAYQNGFSRSIYGADNYGIINVPNPIKDRLKKEADKEALPTLKSIWAMEKSGVDPNSASYMFNPFDRAQFAYFKALTVTSKSEGWDLVTDAGVEIGLQWAGRFSAIKSPNKSFTNFSKQNKGLTVFQVKDGKQFRIDLDMQNGLHYHRRVLGPDGKTLPGQGIGRHRPWQSKSTDKNLLDRW